MSRIGSGMSLSGGGSAAKAAEVFRRMDDDNNGSLDFTEMLQALRELGVLEGLQATEAAFILQKELKAADIDNDGLIDFQEFQNYFSKLARYQQNEMRLQRLRSGRKMVPTGAERNPALKSAFRSYSQFGKSHIIGAGLSTGLSLDALRLTSRQFVRLCKNAGLLKPTGHLEPITVDVIFAQCKLGASNRNMSFKGFLEAVGMLAEAANCSYESLVALMTRQQSRSSAASTDGLSSSPPRKPLKQRASIVAQAWRKPRTSQEQDASADRVPSGSIRSITSTMDRWRSSQPGDKEKLSNDIQKLLEQARMEGAQAASEEWREQQQELLRDIQQLQAQIGQLGSHAGSQDGRPDELGAKHVSHMQSRMGGSCSSEVLSASLKSELEQMGAEIKKDFGRRMEAMERQLQARRGVGKDEEASVNKLRLQVVQLEDVVTHMSETQASFAPNGTGSSTETAPAADFEEAVQALEERALERQARLQAAMLQIASKIDMLEQRINRVVGM